MALILYLGVLVLVIEAVWFNYCYCVRSFKFIYNDGRTNINGFLCPMRAIFSMSLQIFTPNWNQVQTELGN